jgi:hypothetical protein
MWRVKLIILCGRETMENRRKVHFSEDKTNSAQGIDRVSRHGDDFWGRIVVISLLLAAVIGSLVAAHVLGYELSWFRP